MSDAKNPSLYDDALEFHKIGQPGKLEVVPTKPMATQRDLSLAYSPGVAAPCLEIQKNPDTAYDYTSRGKKALPAAIALFAGRLNRLLARWPAANTCYQRAEDAAASAGDMVTVFRSRLGRSGVLRGQGNLPLSCAVAEEVAQRAGSASLPHGHGRPFGPRAAFSHSCSVGSRRPFQRA